MNISQIEYFVATVRKGSFSAAARALFVTPQAVSKAVGDLEEELRVRLCEKTSRGIEPTSFGIFFADQADEILASLRDLERLAKNHALTQQQEGALSVAVACSPYRGNAIKPTDFDAFATEYPQISLSLRFSQSAVCLSALEENVVDAAIVLGRTRKEGLTCVKLFSIASHIGICKTHPLANRTSVHVEELAPYPIATPEDLRCCFPMITHHLETHGCTPHYIDVLPIVEEHKRFARDDNGVVLAVNDSDLFERYPSLVIIPFVKEDELRIPLCLTYRNDCSNPVLPTFERYLMNVASRKTKEKN